MPQVLTTVQEARGGSWSKKGVIVYAPDSGGPLWRVDADGTDAAPLTDKTFSAECSSHRWPVFLARWRSFSLLVGRFQRTCQRHQERHLPLVLERCRAKALDGTGHVNFRLSPKNRLFYIDDKGALVAVPVDADKATVTGKPIIIANQVGQSSVDLLGRLFRGTGTAR